MPNRTRFHRPGPLGLTHDDYLIRRPLSIALAAHSLPLNRPLVVNDNRILLAGATTYVEKYKKYKEYKEKAEKIYGYYERAKKLIDPETRPKALFDELFKLAMDRLTKLFGKGIEKHPFFQYHKTHFDVLRKALDAVGTLETAERALQAARDTVEQMHKESVAIYKEGRKHAKGRGYSRKKKIRLSIYDKVQSKSFEVLGGEPTPHEGLRPIHWHNYIRGLKKSIIRHELSAEDLRDEIDYLQSFVVPTFMHHIQRDCDRAAGIAHGLTARFAFLSTYMITVERYLDTYEKKLKELEKSSAIGEIMADNKRKKEQLRFKKLRPAAAQVRKNAKEAVFGEPKIEAAGLRETKRWVRFAALCQSGDILLYDRSGKRFADWPWETARYYPPEDD